MPRETCRDMPRAGRNAHILSVIAPSRVYGAFAAESPTLSCGVPEGRAVQAVPMPRRGEASGRRNTRNVNVF